MRILLDTQVFLWYVTADARLPAAFRVAVQDPANEVYLSAASIWEAVIKYNIRKLPLPDAPGVYLPQQRDAHGIAPLPIDEGAMVHLEALPPVHRDPFDRILIAQALQHGLTVATVDALFKHYPLPLLPPT
jgi:PIN domain nuclease of toxin-antitoxin system